MFGTLSQASCSLHEPVHVACLVVPVHKELTGSLHLLEFSLLPDVLPLDVRDGGDGDSRPSCGLKEAVVILNGKEVGKTTRAWEDFHFPEATFVKAV